MSQIRPIDSRAYTGRLRWPAATSAPHAKPPPARCGCRDRVGLSDAIKIASPTHPARLFNGLRSVHQRGGRGDDGVLQTPDDLSAVQPDVAHGSHPRRGVVEWQGAATGKLQPPQWNSTKPYLRHRSANNVLALPARAGLSLVPG